MSEPHQQTQLNSQPPSQAEPAPSQPPYQLLEQSIEQQQQQDPSCYLQYPQNQDYHYYQTYDQSSYYASYYQQQWPQLYPQHQNYAFYQNPHDYSSAYQQHAVYYQQPPQQTLSAAKSAVSLAESGAGNQQQNAFNLPQVSVSATALPPVSGINPAAAAAMAALEQLTQFAGTMDAAERAMGGLPPVNAPGYPNIIMRPPGVHKSGGRRGGGHFRGGRSHNFPGPSRGRGGGRGKARPGRSQPQGMTSTSSHADPSANQAAQLASASGRAAPKHQPSQIAWCELCRVDCTSLEILEQHKNGKRHKKNLLRIEELKKAVKSGEEMQNDQDHVIDNKTEGSQKPATGKKPEESQKPVTDNKPEESQKPQIAQDDEQQKLAENTPPKAPGSEPGTVNNLQDNNTGEEPEVVVADLSAQQGEKPKLNSFDNKRQGMKRKMKVGRGGKRIKTFETHKRPMEPPKPKVVIPLICNLCNVKCDTQEVLDRHYSGKKHIAKLKRFEGHQAIYGPTGLQQLYPPNPVVQTQFIPQVHQPFYNSQATFASHVPSEAHQSTAAAAASSSMDPQFPQNSMPLQHSAASSTANAATSTVLRL